jgi:hypothetical protein
MELKIWNYKFNGGNEVRISKDNNLVQQIKYNFLYEEYIENLRGNIPLGLRQRFYSHFPRFSGADLYALIYGQILKYSSGK